MCQKRCYLPKRNYYRDRARKGEERNKSNNNNKMSRLFAEKYGESSKKRKDLKIEEENE